jgi:hypothetical protein
MEFDPTFTYGDSVQGFTEDGSAVEFTIDVIDKYYVSNGSRIPQWKGWVYLGHVELPYPEKPGYSIVKICSKTVTF